VARWSTLSAGLSLATVIAAVPAPSGLDASGQWATSIFIACTTLWVTHVIPFGVTGLLAVALLGLSGAMTPSAAFAAFGNPAVFFLIGVFALGSALVSSGLSKRCALLFLRPFERSPYAFANGMMLAAAFATLWMPNQASAAMLYPIAMEVASGLRLRPATSPYAKTLFLSLAWGAMVASNASILGSTRAALALGILRDATGASVTFVQWIVACLPVVLLGLLAGPVILRLCFPREEVPFPQVRALLERSVADMGPMTSKQWKVAAIVVATVAAWITLSGRVDLAIIALLGACALFATGAITWEEAEPRLHWNIVLMYGGAIALGTALDKSGAAGFAAQRLLGDATFPPAVALGGVLLTALLLSEFMSNAAAVAVVLPLALGLSDRSGASPVALTLAASIGAGLDFALPFSSAPNTLVFSSGYLRMTDVLKAGTLMTIASIVIVMLAAAVWWPLIGLM
jgi:solute carrier family 13 (sodium-dependent dicarboxylate transporter), member 2/3/5